MFHIEPKATLVLDNAAATLAPYLTTAVGAIRIDSDTDRSYEFIASSRTYTGSPVVTRPGTYGQFVPAFELADATRSAAILHVASREDVRTNVGVMNPNLEPVTGASRSSASTGGRSSKASHSSCRRGACSSGR